MRNNVWKKNYRWIEERGFMSISTIGNTYSHMYNTGTKKQPITDEKDFWNCIKSKADEKSSREILQGKIIEMQENIEAGDVDNTPVFQIGASEFSEKEWDTFLENYDEVQEDIREAIRLEHEKALKESEEEAERQKKLLEEIEKKERLEKEIFEDEIDMEVFMKSLEMKSDI